MTSTKKRLHFHLECYFCKIKAHTAILQTFSHILPKFPTDFARIFTQSNVLGVHFYPASYTSVEKYYNGNGLLFRMTQPTGRSTITAIACSKPTISEH